MRPNSLSFENAPSPNPKLTSRPFLSSPRTIRTRLQPRHLLSRNDRRLAALLSSTLLVRQSLLVISPPALQTNSSSSLDSCEPQFSTAILATSPTLPPPLPLPPIVPPPPPQHSYGGATPPRLQSKLSNHYDDDEQGGYDYLGEFERSPFVSLELATDSDPSFDLRLQLWMGIS